MRNSLILLEKIVQMLIGEDEKLKIEEKVDERGVLLTIDVDKQNRGKIIGRGGDMIGSIRYIVKAVGYNENSQVNIKIREDEPHIR